MQLAQQGQPVGAHGRVLGHDHDVGEEGVHRLARLGQRAQAGGEVAGRELRLGLRAQRRDRGGQRLSAGSTSAASFTWPISPSAFLSRLPMRLLAAARLAASGICAKAATARTRSPT